MLGREASYAGTSFVPAEALGSLRFGSDQVNVTADATHPGGLGSYRWDDEGVEAHALPIVRDGVLTGFLSSRETAAQIGLERSGGCMRADGFARQPIVRMTNVNLEPGEAGTLDELIAGTERGLLIDTNRSWSIDDRRLHFQFEGEAGWEIEDGQLGRLVRNPGYAGMTPEFWRSLRRRLLGLRVAAERAARLRQGRAGADDARLARRRRRRASATSRWASRERAGELAEAAVAACVADEALAHVEPRALAAAALRARTGPRRRPPSTTSPSRSPCWCDGQLGSGAHQPDASADALRACAAARLRRRARARRGREAGAYPGFPGRGPVRAHDGHDPETAGSRPGGRRRARWRPRSTSAERQGAGGARRLDRRPRSSVPWRPAPAAARSTAPPTRS